jgi:hypothetical protein
VFFTIYLIIRKRTSINNIRTVSLDYRYGGRNSTIKEVIFIVNDEEGNCLRGKLFLASSPFRNSKIADLLTFLHKNGIAIDRDSFGVLQIVFDDDKQRFYAKENW